MTCQELTTFIKKVSDSRDLIENPERDFERAQELINSIEDVCNKIWPFESLTAEQFQEIYENQKQMLVRRGIVEGYESGNPGIRDREGKFYPMPTFEDVRRAVIEERQRLKPKLKQGFTVPLLVPFGMSIKSLGDRVAGAVKLNYDNGHLHKPHSQDLAPIGNDLILYVFANSTSGEEEILYYPRVFSTDINESQALTKREVMQGQKFPGWQLLFVEPIVDLPSENPETVGGRMQLDPYGKAFGGTGSGNSGVFSSEEMLENISKNPVYADELGMTYESWLALFFYHMEEYGEIMDDYKNGGIGTRLLGSYCQGFVSAGHWLNDCIELYRYHAVHRNNDHSARTVVRVF